MWAGSKTREGENNRDGGRKEGEREKKRTKERRKEKGKNFSGASGDGSVVCETYRSRETEGEREKAKRKGRRLLEIALRVFP